MKTNVQLYYVLALIYFDSFDSVSVVKSQVCRWSISDQCCKWWCLRKEL